MKLLATLHYIGARNSFVAPSVLKSLFSISYVDKIRYLLFL